MTPIASLPIPSLSHRSTTSLYFASVAFTFGILFYYRKNITLSTHPPKLGVNLC